MNESELTSFDDLMQRLEAGDAVAHEEIFRRYAPRLIHVARDRLHSALAGKEDPEDVLQSAFRSFFLRHAEGRFELEDWDALWKLLVVITKRKCFRRNDAYMTERRDVRREKAAQDFGPDSAQASPPFTSPEPSPDEVVTLIDLVNRLMDGFDETKQEIIQFRLQGFTIPEIGERVQRAERTVMRVLKQARERLEGLEPT